MHLPLGLLSFIYSAGYVLAALDPTTLSQHLTNGKDILGTPLASDGPMATWMAAVDDSTPISKMTIPGTHDSATWGIKGVTALFAQTQDKTLFEQMDEGIRFIDLRVGLNNGVISLYHGSNLLSKTATLEDVFWGFYSWIDAHPTETLIISVKIDNGPTDASAQTPIYNLVTTGEGANYFIQSNAVTTLGSCRGKLIWFRRLAINNVPNVQSIGIPASNQWLDNNKSFNITSGVKSLWIEDLYNVDGATLGKSVSSKLGAVTPHLDAARASTDPNDWYITFASGYNGIITPEDLATGSSLLNDPGVNAGMLTYMLAHKGESKGVVLYDFFASEYGLVNATVNLDIVGTPPATSNKNKNSAFKTGAVSSMFTAAVLSVGASILLHL